MSVLDVPKAEFEHAFDAKKKQRRAKLDTELDAAALREVIGEFKKIVRQNASHEFPQDPKEQLAMGARCRLPLMAQ